MFNEQAGYRLFPRLYKYIMLGSFMLLLPFYFSHCIPGILANPFLNVPVMVLVSQACFLFSFFFFLIYV